VVEATFIQLMEVVMQYYSHATMYPTVYTDEQLKRIDHPALLLIGSEDKIYNPKSYKTCAKTDSRPYSLNHSRRRSSSAYGSARYHQRAYLEILDRSLIPGLTRQPGKGVSCRGQKSSRVLRPAGHPCRTTTNFQNIITID